MSPQPTDGSKGLVGMVLCLSAPTFLLQHLVVPLPESPVSLCRNHRYWWHIDYSATCMTDQAAVSTPRLSTLHNWL